MKYYVVVLAAILMTVTLAGCGENYTEDAPTADPVAQTEYAGDSDTSTTDDPGDTEAEDTGDTDDADDTGDTGDAGDTDDADDADDTGDTGDIGDTGDTGDADDADDAGEDGTESETPAPTGNADGTDEVESNEYPPIIQWYIDTKCDDVGRARWDEKWAEFTDERRSEIVEYYEREYGDEYQAYLNGEDYVDPKTKFGSVEAIAALGGKEATVQKNKNECLVFIFDGEKNHGNPYDVTWDYGKDYNSYVAAVDWSLVFDADYYKAAFPMLAVQYHNDDALLLKHFQTVGVHEGRQGSKDFNVAAYMDNCDESLRKAFGDNYECYYMYYLLHQDTESGVKTTGSYKKQLTQELTYMQAKELEEVNKYRTRANVETVEFDSEMAALANYRAYMDCTEGWDEHDGMYHMADTGELYDYMDALYIDAYCENKCTVGHYAGRESVFDAALNYYSSKGHYETMTDPEFGYVGCSNFYVSDVDYNWSGKYDVDVITFDTYADVVTTAYHTK